MGDVEVGDVELLLQTKQQLQDALGDDLIKCRSNFVADDKLRLHGERAGDADALLLPAGQLTRQAVDEALVEFDQLQQLDDPPLAGLAGEAAMELQRPAQDVAHAPARIEGRIGL